MGYFSGTVVSRPAFIDRWAIRIGFGWDHPEAELAKYALSLEAELDRQEALAQEYGYRVRDRAVEIDRLRAENNELEFDAKMALPECQEVIKRLEQRLAHIRPFNEAEWAVIRCEQDVVAEAKTLSRTCGEINTTRKLDRALHRLEEARQALTAYALGEDS